MARKSKRPASRGSVNNIILEVLSTGKKYGYEIIKEVEEKTNGKIKLKQPSLYSSLSRFEEKNYLSSFWQDSDIGGKRHYYELTPLGLEAYRKLASRGQDDDDDVKSDYSPEAIDENQDLEESESTTNETLFEIDEEDDENDIFNNSTELKLKNYSNFDVSERLNELLNEATESNKISEETTPTTSQVESYSEKQTIQNENDDLNITDTDIIKDESVSETFDSEKVEESNNELEEPSSHNLDDDINIVKQYNPFENQSGEIAEIKPDTSETLLNNNLTNSINELDQEIEKIKNEETSLKQKNNEYESAEFQQSLKKIYNDIKNYDASAEDQTNNDMSSVPLSFLEMQRRKASMDILYGNAQNYYYPTDGQNTISQKEEQLNFEEFIKLKQDLNNRRFVYDFSTIYHKKPKPYIIQNLYTNKNSKHIEPTKVKPENNEKKLKYTFDEFGIMKIYNEDSDKNKKKNHIIDNVGYRTGTTYPATTHQQQPQRPNEGNAQTKQEPIKQRQEVQLSEEEIERKNKNFNELFNKISEGKMIQSTQTPPKNEDASNDLKVEYKEIISNNNLEEDNFVDFDNSSKNSYTSHTTLYQEQTQAPATNQIQQNTFSNIKIKTYGEVSSFNEESNKYIAINKLKALLGLSMCFLNIILTTVILLILKSQNLVNNSNSVFYKLSYIFSAILLVISLFPYFINKNKRAEDKFNFNYSIIFSSLTFALTIIVTYAFNTLFGFNFSNFKQFSTSLLIPFVWGLNILVIPVIYKLILKTNIIRK